MAAKRKVPAKKAATRSKHPQIIRLKEFLQNFRDTELYAPERSFCFILGSGASQSAGIPTGASLVNRWLVEMYDSDDSCSDPIQNRDVPIEILADSLLPGETERLTKWSEAKFLHIPGFTFAERAAHYGQIYKARFQSESALGQLFLRKLIHRRPPSIGFHLLARILNRTRHRIVITTNFDHLVEDAIAITENEAIQSYNHEHLASFLRGNAGHPAIAKIHGDILLRTFNADDELENLSPAWQATLRSLFQTHTPIVIGYGGNDPGFMDFLIEEMKGWSEERRCYWFVRKSQRFANVRKSQELAHIPALRLIECPGFTELMVLLDEILKFEPLDVELQERATEIASELKSAATKAKGEVEDHQRKLRESSMAGTSSDSGTGSGSPTAADLPLPAARTWQEWRDAISNSPDPKTEEETIRHALSSLPDSLALQAVAASRAVRREPSDHSPIQEIEKLLKQSESRSGAQSEETLQVMHSLVFAWYVVGEYSRAVALCQRVVSERERVLGPEHPDTLMSRNNLAIALSSQGNYAEAEREHRAVLAFRERHLGPEHLDTLNSRLGMANALYSQGKLEEAERDYRAVLAIQERVLGQEHPNTLGCRNNIANALLFYGKHADAEREHRAVLAIRERILGSEHPDVLLSCFNLSLTLEILGRKQEALDLARRALTGRNKVLGENHPDSQDAKRQVERLEKK